MRAAAHAPARQNVGGLWYSIPSAARVFGVDESTLRRWVKSARLRSEKRLRRKGVWVWSEDVAALVTAQRNTPKGRLPRISVERESA